MNISVINTINVQAILNERGLGNSNAAWLYAGGRVKYYCDKYVPFKQGTLKNTAEVTGSKSGATVTYVQPYAHYQYEGKTMGPNVLTKRGWRSMAPKGGKTYTGSSLTYSHAGRGDHWDEKMLAERKDDLMSDIANYVGGEAE